MKYLVFFLALFLAAAGPAMSQSSTDARIDDCSKNIVQYKNRSRSESPTFTLNLATANGGRLLYVGAARHSYDPNDPQFSEFVKAWNDFRPTTAFFEGSGSDIGGSRDEAIRHSGEPGLVRFLAARDKVSVASLEPSRQGEVKYLLTKFSAEQVKLFYVLRETAQLRERRRYQAPELKLVAIKALAYWTNVNGLENVVRDVAELEVAYRRYWKTPQNWWDASIDWFNPLKSSSQTGGVFANEVNQESSFYRNLHMYEVLVEATLKGERVFAVVGREHVPMQEAALKCAIK
jgi:hypothetical protein